MTGDDVLAAGDFAPRMVEMQRALREGSGTDVPARRKDLRRRIRQF